MDTDQAPRISGLVDDPEALKIELEQAAAFAGQEFVEPAPRPTLPDFDPAAFDAFCPARLPR